ncbi:MAG: GDSL-type esterase/lipase family protein, partial [SAR324 cluster bacterium]|nr:GDSL-type esterase/lipase family protein [SAR324 cluster bacterium]
MPSAFRGVQILLLFGCLFYSGATGYAAEQVRILALGDSLTEGFGVDETEAYPAVLEQLLLEQGYAVRMINGGVSGSTSASALSRLKWYARAKPDFLILAL